MSRLLVREPMSFQFQTPKSLPTLLGGKGLGSKIHSLDETHVAQFVRALDHHRKECEREGKYIEADIASKRLAELKKHEQKKRLEELRERQIAQRLGVEEAHMLELQQFNSTWDRKMSEYEERANELLEAMRHRHMLDLKETRQRVLDHAAMYKPKFSKELLELRRMEKSVARLGQYAEAHQVKVRADALENSEIQRLDAEMRQSASNAEFNMLQKQECELAALRQRIQNGAEEQRKARQTDLERLLQRYQNVKTELDAQQNTEWQRERKNNADPKLVNSLLASTRKVAPCSPSRSGSHRRLS